MVFLGIHAAKLNRRQVEYNNPLSLLISLLIFRVFFYYTLKNSGIFRLIAKSKFQSSHGNL